MKVSSKPRHDFDTNVDRRALVDALRHLVKESIGDLYSDLVPHSVSISVIPKNLYFSNSINLMCLVEGQTNQDQQVTHFSFAKWSLLAKTEYANLVQLWENYFHGDTINRIPKPLASWPQYDLFLMEYISDHTGLLPWLITYTSPFGTRTDRQLAKMMMHMIADWLVAFQSGTSSVASMTSLENNPDIDDAIEEVNVIPYFSTKMRRQLLDWLSSAYSEMSLMSPVLAHGDFTARNILLNQNTVFVVDWEKLRKVRNPLYDVQSFLVNLERRLFFPLCSHQRIKEMKEDFLTCYLAQTPYDINEQALKISRVTSLLHVLKAEQHAMEVNRIQAIIRRRQSFIRYLRNEIEREINIG